MHPVLTALGLGILSGISGVVSPGPVTFLVIQQSVQRGVRGGLLVTAAHTLVGFVLFLVIAFSGARIFFQTMAFQLYAGLIGGIALLVMGGLMIRAPAAHKIAPDPVPLSGAGHSPFVGGIIVSIANPQVFLWWGTVGTTLIGEAYALAGGVGLAAWSCGGIAMVFCWYGGISFLIARGAGRFSAGWVRHISRASGILFLAMGVWFIAGSYALFFPPLIMGENGIRTCPDSEAGNGKTEIWKVNKRRRGI
ncbi:MAG: LysE family translocator [Methanomicrobiales archaeon]|nr:LysE family translocator [Methanomicrobiales archaeon]